MSSCTLKGSSTKQNDKDDHNEDIDGLIMISHITYSMALPLHIKGLWSAVRKKEFFRHIDNTFLLRYFSYIVRMLQYQGYISIFYVPTIAHLSGSLY